MAKNCCGQGGETAIYAGEGIVITGSGTATDPFYISNGASALSSILRVRDTATVDMTLFGAGTLADPLIIEANATMSIEKLTDIKDPGGPVQGDVLTYVGAGAAGHWEFRPPPPVPAGSVNASGGIKGAGSVALPLQVDVAGVWGQGNLAGLGADSTIGLETYIDSAGKVRARPPQVTTVTWETITGKPPTFPATAHTHTWDEITAKPTAYASAPHTHPAAQIITTTNEDIVSYGTRVYAAKSHTHLSYEVTVAGTNGIYLTDWVQNLIASRAPLAHTHSYADIRVNTPTQTITEWALEVFHTKGSMVGILAQYQPALGFTPVRQTGGDVMGWRWNGAHPVISINGTEFETPFLNEVLGKRDYTDGNFGNNPIVSAHGRNNPVVSGYVTAAIDGGGRIAINPSARRFKKNLELWSENDETLDAYMAAGAYRYQLIGGDENEWLYGHIAEELVEAGLGEVVPVDTDPESEHFGEPISVNYELLVVPLQMIAKRQARQIAELQEAVRKLMEGNE